MGKREEGERQTERERERERGRGNWFEVLIRLVILVGGAGRNETKISNLIRPSSRLFYPLRFLRSAICLPGTLNTQKTCTGTLENKTCLVYSHFAMLLTT